MDFELGVKLGIYFVSGALLDILATIDIKAVQNRKAFRSSFVTFLNTIISYILFYYIIQSPEYLLEIISFASGGAVGAYVIIKKGWY
jgi:hypothetical protein